LSLLSVSSQDSSVKELLKGFEQRHSASVTINQMNWESAWSDMMGGTRRSILPGVAEVGTTWVPDLVRVDALSPIPFRLTEELGGEKDYPPHLWKSCFSYNKLHMRAIPWISGSRVIYYRRDLLHKAGVNPDRAFANPTAMLDAVIQLYDAGIAHPWITSNVTSLNSLHLISSWLWAGGGDFISEDGQKLLFAEPGALESMAAFFEMGRYMGGKAQEYSYNQAVDLFWGGNAAITMDGTWRYDAQQASANPDVLDNLGVALPPGPAFVGGSNLVVWTNDTAKNDAAWDLLQFLSEPESLLTIFKLTGLTPAKLSLLNLDEVRERPFGTIFNQAIETGRSLPNHSFSGMVEDMLQYAFGLVWADLLKCPEIDSRDILAEHLLPLKEPWMA
jgi:ABC-type glycerol-3-phosphate transport system substrate-binding protein